MLQLYIEGACVLDLFCGSGAYALEALSRGADCAVLSDKDAKAVSVARENAQSLGFTQSVRIYQWDYLHTLQILQQNNEKFDIIFLDPPYASGYYNDILSVCEQILSQSGLVVCEHASSAEIPNSDELVCVRKKRYGARAITILLRRDKYDRDIPRKL